MRQSLWNRREFTDSLKVYMYIDTPSSIIEIFFILAVVTKLCNRRK